nr:MULTISPECIES: hypothetical protein [Streptomyces]
MPFDGTGMASFRLMIARWCRPGALEPLGRSEAESPIYRRASAACSVTGGAPEAVCWRGTGRVAVAGVRVIAMTVSLTAIDAGYDAVDKWETTATQHSFAGDELDHAVDALALGVTAACVDERGDLGPPAVDGGSKGTDFEDVGVRAPGEELPADMADLVAVGPGAGQSEEVSQVLHLFTAPDYQAEMTIRFAIWDQITGATGQTTPA